MEEVVREVFLDDVALVAQADDEIGQPVRGVHLHDVPQHGAAADLDHRLGAELRLLREAGPEPAGQDHHLELSWRAHADDSGRDLGSHWKPTGGGNLTGDMNFYAC